MSCPKLLLDRNSIVWGLKVIHNREGPPEFKTPIMPLVAKGREAVIKAGNMGNDEKLMALIHAL